MLLQKVHGPQSVSYPGKPHVPAPSQIDLHAPVPAPQSLSGSVPTGWGLHWPARPLRLQETQVPVHALSQQTPSAQNPDAQVPLPVHAWPFLLLQAPVPSHA